MDNGDNIIIRYLDGELSASEKEAFEEQMGSDQTLAEEVDRLKSAREAVRQFGLKQHVASVHQEMMKEFFLPKKKQGTTRSMFRYSVAIAASLILIVGAYIIYNFITLSSDKVFASRYQSYELVNVRDGNNTETAMEKAYKEKDYKQVLKLHKEKNKATLQEKFLCGVSAMELKDNSRAIECFQAVISENSKSRSKEFNDEAEYYLALTYIRNKDYDLALDLLKSIKGDPGHLYHGKVTPKLMRQVRMLKWR